MTENDIQAPSETDKGVDQWNLDAVLSQLANRRAATEALVVALPALPAGEDLNFAIRSCASTLS